MAEAGAALAASRLAGQPPRLTEAASYEEWKNELEFWAAMCGVKEEDQGPIVMMNLPQDSKFGNGIRSSLMGNYKLSEVRVEGGLKKVTDFLDQLLGKSSVTRTLEAWEDFMKYARTNDQSIVDFVTGFESVVRKLKEVGQVLDESSKAFIMLNKANISFGEKSLIMSQIKLDDKTELYNNVRALCIQSFDGINDRKEQTGMASLQIKSEPSENQVLFTQNKKGFKGKKRFEKKNFGGKGKNNRENPKNKYGFTMHCNVCGSKYHLFKDCTERKAESVDCTTEEAEAHVIHSGDDTESDDRESFVYLTENKGEINSFTAEALNAAALDTCCTSSVAGKKWLDIYCDALPHEMKRLIEGPYKGSKRFKFANMQSLKSTGTMRIPICPTGEIAMITVDVLPTDIPLLMSKKDMTRLEMIINLTKETASVKGKEVALESTSAGHFILPLIDQQDLFCVEDILALDLVRLDEKEKMKALKKLHLQFGHRPKDVFVTLLKNAKAWSKDMMAILDKIVDGCEGCILRRRNPDRPAVCLPMANDFNEKVCIDLKHWNNGYILYMIDMYSRFTSAAYISRKTCNEVVDKFMTCWVAPYGTPGAILNDNGGEFTGEELKQLKEVLGAVDCTTAAEAPWQNGICERNHAVVDNILSRVCEDFPDMRLDTAIAWACTAKNTLQQVYGFSPYQLVFGRNPKLPNILSDGPPTWEEKAIGERLSEHLNALHKTREEFTKSENESRIKKALKAKVVATVLDLKPGDLVYYKRDGVEFKGPAKVIVQDGKVIFIREGNSVYRVSANRVVKVGEELSKQSLKNTSNENEVRLEKPTEAIDYTIVPEKASEEEREIDNHDLIINVSNENNGERQSNKRPADDDIQCENRPIEKVMRVCLKKNDTVEYEDESGNIQKCVILGPAGKKTGANKNWYNIEHEDTTRHSIDFTNTNFNVVREEGEECLAILPDWQENEEECLKAKMAEIEKLKFYDTYEEVEFKGQELITTRWVLVRKEKEVRARLTARGFEECDEGIVADSPTMIKTSFRSVLGIAALKGWTLQTIDVKSAFLQGQELDRLVFVKPPKEVKTNKIWRLKKCLYGLKDASRKWYDIVKKTLIDLGCTLSKTDPAIFVFKKDGIVSGVLGTHVDDFLFAGTESFQKEIIRKVVEKFSVGKHETENFTYTGFKLTQEKERIVLDQTDYVSKIEVEKMTAERLKQKSEKLTAMEMTTLRRYVGALNWVVRATRPDLSFDMVHLSTKFNKGIVEDLVRARKVIKSLMQIKNKVIFPKLDEKSLKIVVYTDASFGNLNDGIDSMGANIVFLTDKSGNCFPMDWAANKVKRIVKSTIAAETLALANGLDNAIFIRRLICEMMGWPEKDIAIEAIIDNKSCLDALQSTSLVEDKRLRREISSIQELLQTNEVKSVHWVPGDKQLCDVLTKSGVNSLKLLTVIQNGRF